MMPSLVLAAALTTPAAPVPRDTVPNTTGPAPLVLAVKADANGTVRVIGNSYFRTKVTNQYFVMENNKQVLKQVDQEVTTSTHFNKTLADLGAKFATADGTALTAGQATSRVKGGATLLISADGKPVSPGWLRAVGGDTVVVLTDEFAYAQFTWGAAPLPTTPAPRLVMLGADDSGKVLASVTNAPANHGVYYGEDVAWAGGGRIIRGRGAIMVNGGEFVDYGLSGLQPSATVSKKPLAEIKFDAYDLGGKLIPRTTALKRLAAGGLVLVAGDNRFPDETYLKPFDGDLMVLVAQELVLPVAVKPLPKDVKINPPKTVEVPGGGLQPVPVAPALPVLKPVIRGAKVAPAVEAKPAPKAEKKADEKKTDEKKPADKEPAKPEAKPAAPAKPAPPPAPPK